eukprot:8498735-Alexandrium_andersonii.AAC.1
MSAHGCRRQTLKTRVGIIAELALAAPRKQRCTRKEHATCVHARRTGARGRWGDARALVAKPRR